MTAFTVVLIRSKELSEGLLDDPDPQEEDRIYVALVDAEDMMQAIRAAKVEASNADTEDLRDKDQVNPDRVHVGNYKVLVVFAGHPEIKLFGFQAH